MAPILDNTNTTYQFSQGSLENLQSCDKRLQMLAHRAIDIIDFTVLEGRRSKERQNELYQQGRSKLQWPESNHNVEQEGGKSKAFDIAPYPIDWAQMPDNLSTDNAFQWARERARFYYLAGIMKALAHEMGFSIRWGGDWDGDNEFSDQSFDDLVHFEISVSNE